MTDSIRLILETTSLALGLVMIALAIGFANRVRRLDESTLATRLFLSAAVLRRVPVFLAVAVVLFVTMPIAILGFLLTNVEILDTLHDVSHLLFVAVLLTGLWWLRKLTAAPQR